MNLSPPTLNPLRQETLEFFTSLGRLLGQPKSVAEIYGLLYISPGPFSMSEIMEELQLSKGSASQGLRFLRDLGAIRKVEHEEGRGERYVAETSLKKIVDGFMREELQPHLQSGADRIQRLRDLAAELPGENSAFEKSRVEKLANWYKKGSQLLPFVRKFLQ